MSINFRRLLCSLFRKGRWLYDLFDCQRYEPDEPEYKSVEVCLESEKLLNPYCPTKIWKLFPVDNMPTLVCNIHKKPEPVIPKLDPDRSVKATGKMVRPYFLKGLPVNVGEATDGEVEAFADIITKENHGNSLRFLVGLNGRYCKEHESIILPFFNQDGGKYSIYPMQPNQEWLDSYRRRVGYFMERGWHIELDFYNYSDMNAASEWEIHPLNGYNNHGFLVPELGTIHPTHESMKSYEGAFRLWDSVDKEWSKEPYNYRSESDMTSRDFNDMNANRAVREVNKSHMDSILDVSRIEWGDNFSVGHNEARTRIEWHRDVMLPIYEAHGIGKERRETSFLPDCWDWLKSGAEVWNHYGANVHCVYSEDVVDIPGLGLITLAQLVDDYLPFGVPFMFSSDGVGWKQDNWDKYGKDLNAIKSTVKRCCKIGRGWEFNNDFSIYLGDIDLEAGRVCGQAFGEYLRE